MRIVKVGESYICPVCGKYTFEYLMKPFCSSSFTARRKLSSLMPYFSATRRGNANAKFSLCWPRSFIMPM